MKNALSTKENLSRQIQIKTHKHHSRRIHYDVYAITECTANKSLEPECVSIAYDTSH